MSDLLRPSKQNTYIAYIIASDIPRIEHKNMVLPACPLLNPASWDAHLPMPRRSSHLDGTSRAFPAPTRESDTSWMTTGTAVGPCSTSSEVRHQGEILLRRIQWTIGRFSLWHLWQTRIAWEFYQFFSAGDWKFCKAIQGQDADRDPEVEDPNGLPVSPQPGSQRSAEHRGAVTLGWPLRNCDWGSLPAVQKLRLQ